LTDFLKLKTNIKFNTRQFLTLQDNNAEVNLRLKCLAILILIQSFCWYLS